LNRFLIEKESTKLTQAMRYIISTNNTKQSIYLIFTFALLPWTLAWKQENLNIASMTLTATSKHKTFSKAEKEISITIYTVHQFSRSLIKD